METVIDRQVTKKRVFISYSTADRPRVDGLERLLELFGHEVFLDYKQLRLGSRWKDEIASALDRTDVTLVYWTRSASTSDWVRKEYEYFLARCRERPLVPIIGDETPLPEPLKECQGMDLVPVVNELLEIKRRMESEGRKRAEIQAAIRQRLEQAGVRLDPSDESKVFRFLGVAGWLAWLPAPIVLFRWLWRLLFEAAAQLSPAQVFLILAAAAVSAALTHQAELHNSDGFLNEAAVIEARLNDRIRREQEVSRQAVSQAAAKVTALENRLREAKENATKLENKARASDDQHTKQLTEFYRKAATHALIEVADIEKPMLLRFIDKATGRHRFTVQVPSQEDYSFWLPPGSYSVYVAYTDVSDKLTQLFDGNVELDSLDIDGLKSRAICKIVIQQSDKEREKLTPDKWGRWKQGRKP
jgi:hypothetical protein